MSLIKNANAISKMETSGRLAAEVLQIIEPHVKPGITTEELDSICFQHIVNKQKAIPASLNYNGFPKSVCTSINEVVCHGIPDKTILKNGDIINIDVGIIKDGWFGDTSRMFLVGEVSTKTQNLVEVTYQAMCLGIKQVKPNATLGDIGYTIQKYAESKGYSVVRDLSGHGIGRNYHEEPIVLHYGLPRHGMKLKPGMIFTIEPMINMGRPEVWVDLEDKWTIRTQDKSLSAQWEHTVLVTSTGYKVLTIRDGENI